MTNLNTKKILVPLDFSDTSMNAVRHACFLARLTKGDVLLTHIIPKNHEAFSVIQPELNINMDLKNAGAAIESKLNILCEELHKEFGISVQSVVNIGNVSREILKICQEENCGMIIMGTQGYSAIEMLFIGSNTIKVLGDSDVPVMSVRKPANKHGYKNIILPIDESSHSRQKVGIAIEIAKEFGARLHILGFSEGEDTGFHDKLVNIYSQIDKLANQNNVTTVHETVVNPENNVNTTLEYTSNVDGDLIIIMSDQNKELSGLFLGPYSSQLINSAEVPILTLNPVEQGEIAYATPGTAGW